MFGFAAVAGNGTAPGHRAQSQVRHGFGKPVVAGCARTGGEIPLREVLRHRLSPGEGRPERKDTVPDSGRPVRKSAGEPGDRGALWRRGLLRPVRISDAAPRPGELEPN